MKPLSITHYTLTTALGSGQGANLAALAEGRSALAPNDFPDAPLPTWIGRVPGVEEITLPSQLASFRCRNHQLARLALDQDGFAAAALAARDRYGPGRIALILGTSTSGILETERAYRRRDENGALPGDFHFDHTQAMNSAARFVGAFLGLKGPALVISTACSSSAKVFASAARMMAAGWCDAALVGGIDSLCATTLYGFNSLQLVSSGPCRPGDLERDGISIGEGAAFFLLEREGKGPALLGYGESSDAHHMSSPHPEGLGAALAMERALAAAGLPPGAIDYVNLHGTASRSNDAAEDKAMMRVFGAEVPCSSVKGATGHTLGAAGAVEAAISCLALEHGLIPGACTTRTVDPQLASAIRLTPERRVLKRVMSNSFGFGGNNCSLIFGANP